MSFDPPKTYHFVVSEVVLPNLDERRRRPFGRPTVPRTVGESEVRNPDASIVEIGMDVDAAADQSRKILLASLLLSRVPFQMLGRMHPDVRLESEPHGLHRRACDQVRGKWTADQIENDKSSSNQVHETAGHYRSYNLHR